MVLEEKIAQEWLSSDEDSENDETEVNDNITNNPKNTRFALKSILHIKFLSVLESNPIPTIISNNKQELRPHFFGERALYFRPS